MFESYFSSQLMALEKHGLMSSLAKAGDHESEHEDVLVFAALKKWPTATAEQMRAARENSSRSCGSQN